MSSDFCIAAVSLIELRDNKDAFYSRVTGKYEGQNLISEGMALAFCIDDGESQSYLRYSLQLIRIGNINFPDLRFRANM